jgi:hypothetical protein
VLGSLIFFKTGFLTKISERSLFPDPTGACVVETTNKIDFVFSVPSKLHGFAVVQ